MEWLSDVHMHTLFSDGKQPVEDMVREAFRRGMVSVGISDHSYTPFDLRYCMFREAEDAYLREIRRVKEAFRGRIEVLAGLELDGWSAMPERSRYDYLIGSCHYIRAAHDWLSVDHAKGEQQANIDGFFGGDPLRFARAYYDTIVEKTREHRPDIIGHFDLPVKFGLMPEEAPAYRNMALEALDACLEVTPVVEVNYGGVARGVREDPYPAAFLLRRVREKGGGVILSSDAHVSRNIMYGFGRSGELLRGAGFRSVLILRESGPEEQEI